MANDPVTLSVPIVAGVALSIGLATVAQRRGERAARKIFAIALVIAALIYIAFAITGRASPSWLAIEASGLVLYGALAFAGLRAWPRLLGAGWAAHVVWDVALHLSGPGAVYTPWWYPWLCVGFDVALAVIILRLARQRRRWPTTRQDDTI